MILTDLHVYCVIIPLQLDTATTDNEIDSLLDLPTNTIINASGWSITENITVDKYTLIQHLLIDEVIKRQNNLQAWVWIPCESIFLYVSIQTWWRRYLFTVMMYHLLPNGFCPWSPLDPLLPLHMLRLTTFWWNLSHNLRDNYSMYLCSSNIMTHGPQVLKDLSDASFRML